MACLRASGCDNSMKARPIFDTADPRLAVCEQELCDVFEGTQTRLEADIHTCTYTYTYSSSTYYTYMRTPLRKDTQMTHQPSHSLTHSPLTSTHPPFYIPPQVGSGRPLTTAPRSTASTCSPTSCTATGPPIPSCSTASSGNSRPSRPCCSSHCSR